MACEVDKKRNCFTFIWKVENADCWWKLSEYILSPTFTVKEIDETNWKLRLYFNFHKRYSDSYLYLLRTDDRIFMNTVEIDFELAFLSPDGTVLHSFEKKNSEITKDFQVGSNAFPSRYDVFFARRSEFLSKDTLTVRCRMWKSVEEILKNVQCIARTCIAVEKRLCLWYIENFCSLQLNNKLLYQVKSLSNGERLLSLEFFVTQKVRETLLGHSYEDQLRLKINRLCQNFKMCNLQLSILDASKNRVSCLQCEFLSNDSKELVLSFTKGDLVLNKIAFLPNDVLSLLCECSFSFGNLAEEVQGASSNCPRIYIPEHGKADETLTPKDILINDLKSMLNNSEHADVKLKTRNKTFFAHKLILSLRSPVFKVMFSNDMRETINDCVDIEDFSDETVLQMLRYIYCAGVEEMEWERTTELYEVADKYEILNLKDICSSYMKINLHPSNACEALVLADLHQDEDLKRFVQDYILKKEDIINSPEWDQLMEAYVKLAAETMRLKFKT